MSRLADEMERASTSLTNRAAGFRMAGERELATSAAAAAASIRHAITAIARHHQREAEMTRAKTGDQI